MIALNSMDWYKQWRNIEGLAEMSPLGGKKLLPCGILVSRAYWEECKNIAMKSEL